MDFQKLERVRVAVALVAAVLSGGAALYGVYAKARQATAASYEMLAPEVNDLKQAVKELQEENATLRKAAGLKPEPVVSRTPEGTTRPSAQGRTPARRPRETAPVASAPSPSGPAPTASTSPPGTPTSPAPSPSPGTPPAAPSGAEGDHGVLTDIQKRVPIDFGQAVRVWEDVQKIRKKGQ